MNFCIKRHSIRRDCDVVEIRDDKGRLIGTVCPAHDGRSVQVLSKYATGRVIEKQDSGVRTLDDKPILAFVIELGCPVCYGTRLVGACPECLQERIEP